MDKPSWNGIGVGIAAEQRFRDEFDAVQAMLTQYGISTDGTPRERVLRALALMSEQKLEIADLRKQLFDIKAENPGDLKVELDAAKKELKRLREALGEDDDDVDDDVDEDEISPTKIAAVNLATAAVQSVVDGSRNREYRAALVACLMHLEATKHEGVLTSLLHEVLGVVRV